VIERWLASWRDPPALVEFYDALDHGQKVRFAG
jgi:hypothetical protein